MKNIKIIILNLLIFSMPIFAGGIEGSVTISPGGDFKLTSKSLSGTLTKKSGKIFGKNIRVTTKSLKTGLSLRDTHLHDYLKSDKFPKITVLKALGKAGKFSAVIKIAGVKKMIKGRYVEKGNNVIASFDVKLSKFGIGPISYMSIVEVADLVTIKAIIPLR